MNREYCQLDFRGSLLILNMGIVRTTNTVRAFNVLFLVVVSIAVGTAPVASRLSAPPVAKLHAAGGTPSASDHCNSRPFLEAEGCGQCTHFLTSQIVRDEDAWLLVIYSDRGHVIPQRKLRGRFLRSAPGQLPHEYFVSAMGEALEAIADVEPGAKVNIAIFSEGRPGGMADEHGRRVDWSVAHDRCEHVGLLCSKVRMFCLIATALPSFSIEMSPSQTAKAFEQPSRVTLDVSK